MLKTLCLLSCAWGVCQTGDRTEWQLTPRPTQGQELVYRGTVREESLSNGTPRDQSYRLEARALVLEAKPDGYDIAFLTILKQSQRITTDKPKSPDYSSARLEIAEVDSLGRLTAETGGSTGISLDGPSTWEAGYFVEVPRGGLILNQTWFVQETDRSPRRYQVLGAETVAGTLCVKLVGEQQSEDWDKPRADSAGWRRKETLCLAPRLGFAYRVERVLERRDPAHVESTYRLTTRYELESSLQYNGRFFEDRKREITQARQFHDSVLTLLPDATRHGAEPFEAVTTRIDQYVKKHPVTPYREAVLAARRLAEKGSRGEAIPVKESTAPRRFALDRPAPEFVVSDLENKQTASLRKWRGKTLLMVFYQPASVTTPDVLRHIQKLADTRLDPDFAIVGFAMSDDARTVARLRTQHNLTFPTMAGKSLRMSYNVEATPRIVLVDGEGIVRGAHIGWGPETPVALEADLKKCTSQAEKAKNTDSVTPAKFGGPR